MKTVVSFINSRTIRPFSRKEISIDFLRLGKSLHLCFLIHLSSWHMNFVSAHENRIFFRLIMWVTDNKKMNMIEHNFLLFYIL